MATGLDATNPTPGRFEVAEPIDDVEELDHQVQRGSMFTQAVLQKAFERISTAEARLAELTEALVGNGSLSSEDLPLACQVEARIEETAKRKEEESEETRSLNRWPNVSIRIDAEEEPTGSPVDCAERIDICEAICCSLRFALTSDEIDKGTVKWDIGHPYIIRQSSNGACCHNDGRDHSCRVYDDRPGVCVRYSCRHDDRIWTDFDAMILNKEWVDDFRGKVSALHLMDSGEGAGP